MKSRQKIIRDYLDAKVPQHHRRGGQMRVEYLKVTRAFSAKYREEEIVAVLDRWQLPEIMSQAGSEGIVVLEADRPRIVYPGDADYDDRGEDLVSEQPAVEYKGWRIEPTSHFSPGRGWIPDVHIFLHTGGALLDRHFFPKDPAVYFSTQQEADEYAIAMGRTAVENQ